jgi:hypothetical protein
MTMSRKSLFAKFGVYLSQFEEVILCKLYHRWRTT